MNLKAVSRFFEKPIFRDERFVLGLWVLLAFVMGVTKISSDHNNYQIFKYVFWHTIEQVNLYDLYPSQYWDSNHYGPVFSILIAPFALLPDWLGITLWVVAIALTLYYAVKYLPVSWTYRVVILYICAHEMMTAASNQQTNALIAALIMGSFISIHKGKDFWAALFIALGFFVKLYGIVGFAFFFFSKNKIKLLLSFVFWSVILFVLPMLISSPEFIIQSYKDWFNSLVGKNMENTISIAQDISVMGMFRKISGNAEVSNLLFIVPGLILFGLQYLKLSLYQNLNFRLGILASTLLFVVLFSSGSESSTYIIAMVGVAIWFIMQQRPFNWYAIFLLVFVLVITSFSPSDLFPAYIRENLISPYALKALPCFMVWLTLIYQILTQKGLQQNIEQV